MTALERAYKSHAAAASKKDADLWDVAGDAWEEYGVRDRASLCREMARLTREGKNPSIVPYDDGVAILHDEPAPSRNTPR